MEGVPYTADIFDDGFVSVLIDIAEPLTFTGEVDARGGRPEIKNDLPFKQEAEELLTMGAIRIDATGDADQISADFPLSVRMDAALAEKAARLLVSIRRKASNETQSFPH